MMITDNDSDPRSRALRGDIMNSDVFCSISCTTNTEVMLHLGGARVIVDDLNGEFREFRVGFEVLEQVFYMLLNQILIKLEIFEIGL